MSIPIFQFIPASLHPGNPKFVFHICENRYTVKEEMKMHNIM